MKTALCSDPILGHPDFSPNAKPFILYTDASRDGVGAVLSQVQTVIRNNQPSDQELVISYASKALSRTQRHYSSYRKELLGMVYAINHFRYYLLGKKFILRTDHLSLNWLLKTRSTKTHAIFYRYQDLLAEYDFDIQFVPGRRLGNADGLSRMAFAPGDTGVMAELPDFAEAQKRDDDEFWLEKMTTKEEVNALGRPKRLQPPPAQDDPDDLGQEEADEQQEIDVETQYDFPENPVLKIREEQQTDPLLKPLFKVIEENQREVITATRFRELMVAGGDRDLMTPAHTAIWKSLSKIDIDPRVNLLVIDKEVPEYEGKDKLRRCPIIPQSLVPQTIAAAHKFQLHPGQNRTYLLLNDRVWWPGMKKDVVDFVSNCATCAYKSQAPENVNVPLGQTTSSQKNSRNGL